MAKTTHSFLLSAGTWLGTGTIGFTGADEQLTFYARWVVAHGEGIIQCTQTVEIEGGGDHVLNGLTFMGMDQDEFKVILENATLGKVEGKGLIDKTSIAWEFEDLEQGFEGFEVYEQEDEEHYVMRAEYLSLDQARTKITGKLWKEGSKS